MLRVGLTGGLASGKSFVGDALAELGCFLIRADEIGHSLLERSGAAYAPVVAEFGRGILGEAEEIDRKRLASIVFADPSRLAILNALVHPLVFEEEDRRMAEYASVSPSGIAVVEAAILVETGSYKRFERLIVVFCARGQQIERALAKGYSLPDAEARLARQMAASDTVKFADFVIDTSGSREETLRQTRLTWEKLRELAG